jgi:hypothetical protein
MAGTETSHRRPHSARYRRQLPMPLSPRSSLLKQARRRRSQYEARPPHSRRYRRQLPSPTSPRSPLNSHARLSRAQYPPSICASSTERSNSEELLKIVVGADATGSVNRPRPTAAAIAMTDLRILLLPFSTCTTRKAFRAGVTRLKCRSPSLSSFQLGKYRCALNVCSCSGPDHIVPRCPGSWLGSPVR